MNYCQAVVKGNYCQKEVLSKNLLSNYCQHKLLSRTIIKLLMWAIAKVLSMWSTVNMNYCQTSVKMYCPTTVKLLSTWTTVKLLSKCTVHLLSNYCQRELLSKWTLVKTSIHKHSFSYFSSSFQSNIFLSWVKLTIRTDQINWPTHSLAESVNGWQKCWRSLSWSLWGKTWLKGVCKFLELKAK